jgi:hypothetical protein
MKLIRILFVLVLIAASVSSNAQKVFISSGYGTYAMTELKSFQSELAADINLPVALSQGNTFPGYFNFEFGFSHKTGHFLYGAYLGYGSTGARTGYDDFSGHYYIDQEIKYFSFGGSLGYIKELKEGKLFLELDTRPGIFVNRLGIFERVNVGTTNSEFSLDFESINVALQPSISLNRNFSKFGIQALLGYHISMIKGNLYLIDDTEAFLLNNKGNKIQANWTGLRCSLGFSILL